MRATLFFLILFAPLFAQAADNTNQPASPAGNSDIPAPPTVADDQADEPQITIKQKGPNKIEEYRIHGQLYMMRIIPAKGAPYYLVDPTGKGQFVRQDLVQGGLRPPMWILHQW